VYVPNVKLIQLSMEYLVSAILVIILLIMLAQLVRLILLGTGQLVLAQAVIILKESHVSLVG
jgi:hypothetical protein